jgi:hypothetical protein
MRESKPVRLVVCFIGGKSTPRTFERYSMKEMRPITYKDLTPAKAVYDENEDLRRLINELRAEVNALRNRVNFLEKYKDAE